MRLLLSLLLALGMCGCLHPVVDPVPGPDVVVPVADSKYMVVVVENTFDRTPDSPQVDLQFWESVRNSGYEFRIIDAESNPFAKKFQKQSDRHGIPTLILLRISDGRVMKSEPLPKTTDEIGAFVKKYGR